MAKGKAPTSTTLRDPERAAELARLAHASRRANKAAASAAATQAAARPQAPSPYLNPQSAAGAAQANALADLFRLWHVAASLRLHRIAPVWSRGYLEDTDQATVDSAGGLHRYLADVWGGDRYRVELIDATGAPMGPGWTLSIHGPVRSWGRVEHEPPGYSSPAPSAYPPPSPVGPVAIPATPAPAAPAPSALNPAERGELVQLVRRLADQLEAAQHEIARLRSAPPAAAPASAPSQDIGAVFQQARSTLAAAREFADEVDAVAGPPAPARNDDDDDRHSPIARDIMRGLARKIGEGIAGVRSAGGGNGSGHTPAPCADAGGGACVEAEIVQ